MRILPFILNDENSNILKASFLIYTNPLQMGTKMNITDLGSSIFDNIEQQDSGDFLRHLLECRAGNWKNVEDNKCAHCGNYLKHQSLIQDTGREFVFSLSLLDSANRKINNFNLITA